VHLASTARLTALVALLGWLLAPPVGHAAGKLRSLPKRYQKAPYSLMSVSVGHPNAGWQARASRVKPRRGLKIKKSSRKHSYGHPSLVKMLYRSSRDIARSAPGSIMVLGDLSAKGGGPLAGHQSHQSGRDVDIAFYAKDKNGKSVALDHFVAFGSNGKARDGSGLVFDDWRNWLLVQSWLRDRRAGLSHIFVSRGLRGRLLRYAESRKSFRKYLPQAKVLLKQPEDSTAHNDHFHLRIACPKSQADICKDQPKR
jgi:penicillin-insensitive murein endopeptidase